jgi:hypothetical protein
MRGGSRNTSGKVRQTATSVRRRILPSSLIEVEDLTIGGEHIKRGLPKMHREPTRIAALVAASLILQWGLQIGRAAAQEGRVESQQEMPTPRPPLAGQQGVPATSALTIPGGQAKPELEVPQVWHPTATQPLPPAPPAIPAPVIPASFVGCWEGNAGAWDEFTWLPTRHPLSYNIGAPGKIRFCYKNSTIEVPRADVYISPAKHALDVALNLGLNYNTASAHSISTDIYTITPTMIHSRTQLTVVIRAHLLLLIPFDALSEPVIDDETARLVAPNVTEVIGRQVLMLDGAPQFSATWHASFNRVADAATQ